MQGNSKEADRGKGKMLRNRIEISEKNFVGYCVKHRMKLSKQRVKNKGHRCAQCFHARKLRTKGEFWGGALKRFKRKAK